MQSYDALSIKGEIMPGPGAYLIGEEELNEVLDVLKSKHISRYGSDDDASFRQKVHSLEREFAAAMNAQFSVAVNSGTSALMSSLVSLGVGRGDEVLVPGYTFIASISSIIAIGGTPVLVEVDKSLTMDPADMEKKITKKTKAVMPVHMLGNPSDMKAISDIAGKHNLFIVEDCCQALGGTYQGKSLGTFGDIGAYSLNVYKVINAGDAGLRKNVIQNSKTAQAIIAETVGRLGGARTCPCATALASAIITSRDAIPAETRAELAPIVGKYL